MDKIVQIKNPRSGHYVKINQSQGRLLGTKKDKKPWKNVKIVTISIKQKDLHVISLSKKWSVNNDGVRKAYVKKVSAIKYALKIADGRKIVIHNRDGSVQKWILS